MVKCSSIILVLLFSFLLSYGQVKDTVNVEDDYMITYIGEPPVFKGNLLTFIREQIHYPLAALKDSLEGTVFISFWIDTLGATYNHRILRGVRSDLDNEALRVSKLIRFEKPAMTNGKPIKVPLTLPFRFSRKLSIKNTQQ